MKDESHRVISLSYSKWAGASWRLRSYLFADILIQPSFAAANVVAARRPGNPSEVRSFRPSPSGHETADQSHPGPQRRGGRHVPHVGVLRDGVPADVEPSRHLGARHLVIFLPDSQ